MTRLYFRRKLSENGKDGVRVGIPREIVSSIGCCGSYATIYEEHGIVFVIPDSSMPLLPRDVLMEVFPAYDANCGSTEDFDT